MGRVINLEGAGKERKRLTRAVALALRELMQQTEPNAKTRDLAAFISLALDAVYETIDESVGPWEKRGYWLKADRFRLEWTWTGHLGEAMRRAILAENWGDVAAISAQVAERLNGIKVAKHHRMGTPWEGALERLKSRQ